MQFYLRCRRYSAILGLVAVTFPGCDRPADKETVRLKPNMFLFSDMSSSYEIQKSYIVRDGTVVYVVGVLPNHDQRKVYQTDTLPFALEKQLNRWKTHPGDLTPPFSPHHPLFCRSEMVDGHDDLRETTFFDYINNEDARKFFGELEATIAVEANRCDDLPAWIKREKALMKFFDKQK